MLDTTKQLNNEGFETISRKNANQRLFIHTYSKEEKAMHILVLYCKDLLPSNGQMMP